MVSSRSIRTSRRFYALRLEFRVVLTYSRRFTIRTVFKAYKNVTVIQLPDQYLLIAFLKL